MEGILILVELIGIVIHYVERDYGRYVVFHVAPHGLTAHHAAAIGEDSVGEERLLGPLHLDDDVPACVGHAVDVEDAMRWSKDNTLFRSGNANPKNFISQKDNNIRKLKVLI